MKEFFSDIFNTSLWPPRWNCGYWSEFHGWLYILSDIAIWAAYFTIPVLIISYLFKKKQNIPFERAYLWFAAFILACGFTHLLDASIFWFPMYRVSALVRFVTALISWLTVYHLFKMLPRAFSLKSSKQLEDEALIREKLVNELQEANLKLKTQNEFIEKIFDSTIDHINVFDLDLNLLSINKRTQTFLGKNKSELVGKNFTELFPHVKDGEYLQNLRAAAKGVKRMNFIFPSPSGNYYETSFIPLYENDLQYAVLIMSRDVTEHLRRENELNLKNSSLQKANEDLEHFTHILSHDLQEPLRKITLFSNKIIDSPDPDKLINNVNKIITSAKRMATLIKDVLDYSKLTDTSVAFAKVDLNEVLDNVKADLEVQIALKQADISSESLPEIMGVQYQLNQVFYNLISNSLKYSIEKPKIEIIVKPSSIDDNFVDLSFKDNGIGFDEIYKDQIFSPFRRLQTKANYEGSGIGLSLVKKIIESHGGKVDVKSKQGVGSEFIISLRVAS